MGRFDRARTRDRVGVQRRCCHYPALSGSFSFQARRGWSGRPRTRGRRAVTADPFERLRAMNPVGDPGLLRDPREDPRAQEILDRVLAIQTDLPGRRRRRDRRILIPVAIAAAACAAAAWVITRPADDPTHLACYESVSLDSDIVAIEPTGGDPADACKQVWETGPFRRDEVPPLAACVLDSGIVGVFPADQGDPCTRLGLDLASTPREPAAIIDAQERIADRLGGRCVPVPDAVALVRGELASSGLDDWRVVAPDQVPDDRPCASAAVDAATETVTIVPIPATPPSN